MGDNDHSTIAPGEGVAAQLDKGKGKAVENPPAQDLDVSMDEQSSSEESDAEEPLADEDDEDENDEGEGEGENIERISADNIISGPRTRGKTINYAEAAEKSQAAGDEMEDDDDDEDFQAPDEDSTMKD